MSPIRPTSKPTPEPRPVWHLVAGLGLTVPALVLLVTSYVEPAAWAVRTSLSSLDIRSGTPIAGGGGSDNFRAVLDGGFGRSVGFALSLLLVPLIVVAVVAPVLAWCATRGGTVSRSLTRALLALPLACYAPAAVALGWRIERVASSGVGRDGVGLVREASWLAAVGLTSALAVTGYLAALRRFDPEPRPGPALRHIDPEPRPGPALWVVGVLGCLITAALALQTFTMPYLLAGSGRSTDTPLIGMLSVGVGRGPFGPAAAIATMLLALLAVLGVAVTVTILISGVRLEVDRAAARVPLRPLPATAAAVLLVAILGISLYALSPWLGHTSAGALPSGLTPSQVITNTWLPPLPSTLVGVAVAGLAGFGIGALRPFGRRSELLLLPFAPFLLVGSGPLALRAYAAGATADRWDSVLGLVPPTRLVIPALFVFTLLFRGQSVRAERERQLGAGGAGWWRGYLAPALPMLLIVVVATWVVQAQDLIWPMLSGGGRYATGPVVLVTQLRASGAGSGDPSFAPVLPPVLLVLLVAGAVVFQLTYLDRVALRVGRRVGRPEYEGGPRT